MARQLSQIGVKLVIRPIAPEEMYTTVLEPHDYELLLSGELLGGDSDVYAYWHSSQVKKGGFNLALYANSEADAHLEKARTITDENERAVQLRAFQDILAADLPAIFLYQSTYTYAISKKIKGVVMESILSPADRFSHVTRWYIKTKTKLQ